jgi:Zn-dependent peptidase ImmA (M78 family)/transcriptional regulator with XRE-family HTH domain
MRHPERLRDARLLIGATQEELASSSGVSQAAISMIERGDRPLSEDVAAAVGHALGLPVEFFEIAPSTIPDAAIDFRKLKTASIKDSNRARVLFREAYRAISHLMTDASYPLPTLPVVQQRDFPLDDTTIETLAAETRQHLQLDLSSPIPNVLRALEHRGIGVTPLVVPGGEEDPLAPVEHFGASHWPSVHDPAVVGYFPGSAGDRDRFTLSHELGHLVLHTFRPFVPSDVRELESNRFASAFLFPLARARESLGPTTKLKQLAELKARWGMSMQAIIMRGKQTGLLSPDHASSLFRQISARGWRKSEPVQVAHESPMLVRTLLERKYGSRAFTSLDVERELALPIGIIKSLAPGAPRVDQAESRDNVTYARFGSSSRS